MKQLQIATVAACLLTAVGLGFAGSASAAPSGSRSAADVVGNLEAQGHHVQINGSTNVPLSLCNVTSVHGLNNSNIDSSGARIDKELYSTVYVDVVCQQP